MLELTPTAARAARCRAQLLTAKDRAAEDVSWLTGLCSHRARSGVEKRRAALGLTLDDVLRAGAALVEATTDPERLPEHVAEKALSFVGPRGADDAESDELLRRLVVKHLRGRGPAQVSDIAWWSGHANATIRRAVDIAGDPVAEVSVAGERYLMLAEAAEEAAANPKARPPRGPIALPAFDEYLMGYGDRTLVLDKDAEPELFALIGPTKNGLVNRATMKAGRIVDTWDDDHPAASDYLKFAGR